MDGAAGVALMLGFMLIWGFPMWICGDIAHRRGHSVGLWIFLSLLFSWLAVIFAALMQDRTLQLKQLNEMAKWRESQTKAQESPREQ